MAPQVSKTFSVGTHEPPHWPPRNPRRSSTALQAPSSRSREPHGGTKAHQETYFNICPQHFDCGTKENEQETSSKPSRSELAAVEFNLSEYIPNEVFDQPKKGFSVPLADWIRGSFKDEFSKYLKTNRLKSIENLDIAKIQRLFELHLTTDVDYSAYLWRVYVLSKWIHLNKEQK